MEVKKSYQADLERRRPIRFLLGLVVAAALFFVALEYNFNYDESFDESLLEDIAQDLEALPARQPEPMMIVEQVRKEPVVAEKINVVKNAVEEKVAELSPTPQLETEGIVDDAVIEETTPEALTPADVSSDQVLHFRVVEEMPEFPGGMAAFMKWLTQNLHYPPAAKEQKQQGTVVVSFVVNADGTVSNARLVKPKHVLLDREAMRVLRMMPDWKPGQDHGKPCRTLVCIPIVFQL